MKLSTYFVLLFLSIFLLNCGSAEESNYAEKEEATEEYDFTEEDEGEEDVEVSEEANESKLIQEKRKVIRDVEEEEKETEEEETDEEYDDEIEEDENSINEQKTNLRLTQNKKRKSKNSKQKIIKNANLRFQVKNLNKSLAKIKLYIRQTKAYVASTNQDRSSGYLQSNFVIRVPNKSFDELVNLLVKESVYLEQRNIEAKDVTEEFVDIQARLKTKRKVEERYIEILKEARNIEEILLVEDKLRFIREEIEAKEGRLKYLVDRVKFSTITLEVYENKEVAQSPDDGFFTKSGKGFLLGWTGILEFLVGLITIWPALLVIGVVLYLFRKNLKQSTSDRKNENN